VSDLSKLWTKLSGSKSYREALVASQLKRGLPFQARSMRKERGWSQAHLAEKSELTQGVVSRAEDPDYGNLTFNTVLRVAAGHDVAVICKFVSFSEFAKWYVSFSEDSVQVPSFGEEDRAFHKDAVIWNVPTQATQNPTMRSPVLPWSAELHGTPQEKKQSSSEHNFFSVQGELADAASGGSSR
jgi:hypothetical protein